MVPARQSATPLIEATLDGEMTWEKSCVDDTFVAAWRGRGYIVGRGQLGDRWFLRSYVVGRDGREDEWYREGCDSEITTLHALARGLV